MIAHIIRTSIFLKTKVRKQKLRITVIFLIILFLTSGCASYHYSKVNPGKLSGKLIVQWYKYDRFIFIPDKDEPLTFFRSNGKTIIPGQMYTDGGSIPRPLWAIKSYSPWGYAPAFMVHDWLFVMQHCKYNGYEDYDVDIAALIMSEVIKTLMEDPEYGGKYEFVLYSMYEAVRSPIAKRLWEEGECNQPWPPRQLERTRSPQIWERVVATPLSTSASMQQLEEFAVELRERPLELITEYEIKY